MASNVLFILTSHSELGETGKSTGYHLHEAAAGQGRRAQADRPSAGL